MWIGILFQLDRITSILGTIDPHICYSEAKVPFLVLFKIFKIWHWSERRCCCSFWVLFKALEQFFSASYCLLAFWKVLYVPSDILFLALYHFSSQRFNHIQTMWTCFCSFLLEPSSSGLAGLHIPEGRDMWNAKPDMWCQFYHHVLEVVPIMTKQAAWSREMALLLVLHSLWRTLIL